MKKQNTPPPTLLRHSLRRNIEIGEVNTGDHITQPDMSFTVPALLQRFSSGRPLPDTSSRMVYTGDDYTPDTRQMDFVDIDEMKQDAAERIAKLQKEFTEKNQLRTQKIKEKNLRIKKAMDFLEKQSNTSNENKNIEDEA